MQEISPEELSEQLQNGDESSRVFDSRHEAGFEEWHIPGSINVDLYDKLTEDPEQESVPADELAELEPGPNNCAAE